MTTQAPPVTPDASQTRGRINHTCSRCRWPERPLPPPREPRTRYVVLGNAAAAQAVCDDRGLNPRDMIVACRVSELRGLSGPLVVIRDKSYHDLPAADRELIGEELALLRAVTEVVDEPFAVS